MNTQQLEVLPEEKQIQTESQTMLAEAESFKVIDDLSLEECVRRSNLAKDKFEKVVLYFKEMRENAHKTWKSICQRQDLAGDNYEQAKKIYTQKGADFQKKKEDEFKEKERKAKEDAEKKEREERSRLAEEQRKKEAEEAKKREEAKKAEEAAKKALREGDEKKAAEQKAKAEKAKEEADAAQKSAEALEEKKANVYIAPKPVQQVSRPAGMSVQSVWVPEIVDAAKVPVKWYTEIDLGRLKRAKTADPTLNVPGIRFVQKAQGAALGGGK